MKSKEWWRSQVHHSGNQVDQGALMSGLVDFLETDSGQGLVVSYWTIKGEIDISGVLDRWPNRLCLTRTPSEGMDLTVHRVVDSDFELHRFGYQQPTQSSPVVPDADISVVLVPGLRFDRFGGRLGRGQGYYDRLLARLPHAIFVGITADKVLAEPLPVEPHDISMTHLATSGGVVAVASPLKMEDPRQTRQ